MATVEKFECNNIRINNPEEDPAIIYTIRYLDDTGLLILQEDENGNPIENFNLLSGEDVEYTFEDGLYAISVDGGPNEYFILDCKIQECALDLRLKFLCSTDSCNHFDYRQSQYNAIKFYSLFQILYAKWNEWKIYRTIGSTTNETTASTDAIYISDLIKQLTNFCKTCDCSCGSNSSTYKSTDCGCS